MSLLSSSSSNESPHDLHKSLVKELTDAIKLLDKNEMIEDNEEQDQDENASPRLAIDTHIGMVCFKAVLNFAHWHSNQFVPAVRRHEKSKEKSLEQAFEYEKMASAFLEMSERDYGHDQPQQWKSRDRWVQNGFKYINKAIKSVPHDEPNLVCQCFATRSKLHRSQIDLQSALSDIECALHFRAHSFSAIKRKVKLLFELNRQHDAYRFVDTILHSQMAKDRFSQCKLNRLNEFKQDLYEFVQLEKEQNDGNDSQPAKQACFIQINGKVCLFKNELNKRFGLKASGEIAKGTVLLQEEPCLLALKEYGLLNYCANCRKNCCNTFWPCVNCTEVIYCSQSCASADANLHAAQCGIVDLINQHEGSRASQVYRHLAQLGHHELVRIDHHKMMDGTSAPLDEYLEKIRSAMRVSSQDIDKWFASAKSDLIQRLYRLRPKRTAGELGAAIFLISLYLYKQNIPTTQFDEQQLFDLIRIVSTDLAVVALNEYGWNEIDNRNQKHSIGAFQCLFSSRVGHSCEPNAEWRFNGAQFVLQSKQNIKTGEEITISFGVKSEDSFLARQAQMMSFAVMCACDRCMTDSGRHFCLRCDQCGGPVPWHKTALLNWQCMRCEGKCSLIRQAAILEQGLKSIQSATWLLLSLECNLNAKYEDYYREVQDQLTSLVKYVHPGNLQLQGVIRDLASQYITRGKIDLAVHWYQWLVEYNGIHLTAGNGTGESDDPLACFHFANQWVDVFFDFLERSADEAIVLSEYIQSAQYMITQMCTAMDQWEATWLKRNREVSAGGLSHEEYSTVLDTMKQKLNGKYERIVIICRSAIDQLAYIQAQQTDDAKHIYETTQD